MARSALLLPTLFGLGFTAGVALADPLQESEALAMLQRIADAARQLNYTGTFVYQHGDQVETSRIVHFADSSGEYEKLETLDGPRREIIRNNDEVMCYYLDAKIMRSEKRVARRTFPALLPDQLSALTVYYQIRKGEPERIAGFDSQALVLEPRDGMRYGHKFWAETNSGLLLKARMVNERHNVVEQFSFTQLAIGSGISRDMVKPSFSVSFPEWRVDRFAHNLTGNVE
ncbi:MAG: sigma-E factor regulatory protein RseB domain-containing protein, partial [Burkholderiales bacterium]